MKCRVWSVECTVGSVKCGVESVECTSGGLKSLHSVLSRSVVAGFPFLHGNAA